MMLSKVVLILLEVVLLKYAIEVVLLKYAR